MPNEFVAKNGIIAQNNSVVSGSLIVTNGITGSLFGTSSQALSASYTATSSFGLNAISASYAFTASSAISSSLSQTASFSLRGSGSFTGSFSGSVTASLFGTASQAITASYAINAANAFIQGGNSFGTTATIGTNDAQALSLETNAISRIQILNDGNIRVQPTASMKPFMDGMYIDTHPEGDNPAIIPYLGNDIAYNTLKGGTFTGTPGPGSTVVTSAATAEALFDGAPTYAFFNSADLSGSYTASIIFPQLYNYGNTIGFSFGNAGWRARDFKVEILVTGSYYTLDTVTNWQYSSYNKSFNYAEQAVQGAKITFSNFNSTGFRIADIYLINYNSIYGKGIYVGRDGGQIYKGITVTGSVVVTSGGFTGSLFGTASQAVTSSFALRGNGSFTGSFSGSVTASLFGTASQATSASYAFTASSASNSFSASFAQTSSFANNFTVANTLTAQTLVVSTISSSVVYSSGSNIFGNSTANTQTMTGSLNVSGSATIIGRVTATNITGSLFGTASWATNFITGSVTSASFASTASFVNILNQNVIITGSLTVGQTTTGAGENTLTLGPAPAGGAGEGGQLLLMAKSDGFTSASMLDVWQNQFRILRGTNASSDGLVAQWNLHSKQVQFPAYTGSGAFTGSAVANLAVDSSGNILTVATGSGGGGSAFPFTGSAQITGSLGVTGSISASGAIISTANGTMYFRGGDDAELWDINVTNTVGVYGQQDQTVASIKLGSGGGTISGRSGNIGIGTITPNSASLHINGNVFATSFTGSLLGTATSASYAFTASSAISSSYAFTASSATTASTVIATVTGTNSTELVRGNMADNDQFRILVGGTATNTGFAEIATADDGTEPIHVRQYSGVFASLVRTATLLDGSGNTSFPGTVSAAFSGNLTGTASFALRGSGSFTGSFSGSVTGSLFGTASQATSASYAFTASSAISSSFAVNYLGSGSISTRLTNLETASGSFSTRVTNTETTASNLVAASASFSTRITSDSSSFSSRVSSIEATTASLQVASGSFSTRVTQIERTYATTGSNIFTGSQNILGAITASAALINGTLTAQTLVVTTISSSVVFSSGSNIFGNSLTNVQQFTGSLRVTGSGNHWILGGRLGIGVVDPSYTVDTQGDVRIGNYLLFSSSATGVWTAPVLFRSGTWIGVSDFAGVQLGGYDGVAYGPRFTVMGSGNTGVGLVNPTALFHISGSGSGSLMRISSHVSSSIFFVSGSGNIGIGTIMPTDHLSIEGSGDQAFSIYSNTTGVQGTARTFIKLFGTNTSTTKTEQVRIASAPGAGASTAGQLIVSVNNSSNSLIERLRIDESGNVGIGNSSPSALLHISGSDSGSLFRISSHTSSSLFFVSGSGNVGIGTITPEFKLDVSGSGQARIGAAELGNWPSVTNYAFFGHERLDQTAAGNYALLQDSGGSTYVNASTGRFIALRINNITTATVESTRFTFTGSFGLSGSMLVTGSITGSLSGSVTGSLFGTASQAVSSSYALTASFALNGGGGASFPYTGSAQITGSLGVTGSFSVRGNQGSSVFSSNADTLLITGSLIITGSGAITGSLNVSNGITGSLFGTASQAVTASYALTASFVASIAGLSTSQIATGSITASVSLGSGSFAVTSGSSTFLFVSSSGNVGINNVNPLSKLQISGDSSTDPTTNIYSQLEVVGSTNSARRLAIGYNTNSNYGLIQALENATNFRNLILNGLGGNVGVATQRPSASLDVSGSVRITNGLSETGSVNISGSVTVTGSITTNGTITAQTLVVQTITSSITYSSGSNIFGNALTNTQTMTGSVNITGSLTLRGDSILSGSLIVTGSLTGSNARFSGIVTVQSASFDYGQNTNVVTGSFQVIASEATSSFRCAFFDYVMFSGSVVRAGTVTSTWSGGAVEFNESYTNDLSGSTAGVTLQAALSGGNIQLQATASSQTWTIRSLIRLL